MKHLISAIFLVILFSQLNGQTISGSIKSEGNLPLTGVTVTLLTTKDSLVKMELTKKDGSFSFVNVASGWYRITASHVGFEHLQTMDFNTDSVSSFAMALKKSSRALATVVVTAKKPLIQVKADRIILNVEGSVNATGNTVLELLRKSPGVSLDKDDMISMNGKNGVRIFIDGRPTGLSGQDLTSYLQALSSSSVESIELITNPSARFEAAGNAGIINIRLKKNTALGTNGAVHAGFNIGRFPKYNSGFTFNHRNENVNLFGNINVSGGQNDYKIGIYRSVQDSLFDQIGNMRENNAVMQFKTGIDYTLNPKTVVGATINGNFSRPTIISNSNVTISSRSSGVVDRLLVAGNRFDQTRKNLALNLNYSYRDTLGKSLLLNADHAFYNLTADQMQPNEYFDPSGTTRINRVVYQMISPTDIQITSLNGDYEQQAMGGKLSAGGKWATIHTDNNFERYNVFETRKELDKDRSNRFRYKENISAAYANFNKSGKGFVLQLGARLEHTRSHGRSAGLIQNGTAYIPYDSSFTRRYTNLFPSAAITLNKDPMKQWTLSYSRRIDRPVYQELNPFEFKVDEYTSQKGSVDLRPQYTNSLSLTHVYKHKLTASLNYSHINDLFVQLMDTVEKSKAFVTYKNVGVQDVIGFSVSYPFQYRSYTLMANTTANYKTMKADFGTGREINLNVTAVSFFAQNTIQFGKAWTGEVTGFYNSPTIYGSNLKSRSMWSIDAGIQKQIFSNKGSLKFSVSDVFNSLRFEGLAFFAGQETRFTRKAETRQAKISFTWQFGNNKVKAAREKRATAEDEMKRVQ